MRVEEIVLDVLAELSVCDQAHELHGVLLVNAKKFIMKRIDDVSP